MKIEKLKVKKLIWDDWDKDNSIAIFPYPIENNALQGFTHFRYGKYRAVFHIGSSKTKTFDTTNMAKAKEFIQTQWENYVKSAFNNWLED